MPEVVVVGSGPNGLAAAVVLAEAGHQVRVLERAEEAGGGMRSAALTRPGVIHDVCSTVQPLAVASPFFRAFGPAAHGVRFLQPPIALAHPFDDGSAAVLDRSLARSASGLGVDGPAYAGLLGPLVAEADRLLVGILGPARLPTHPWLLARFGLPALHSAVSLTRRTFRGPAARALFAGIAAHGMVDLRQPATAAFGLVLGLLVHRTGWPFVAGGSGRLAQALMDHLETLGAKVETAHEVRSLRDLVGADAVLLDVTPRQLLALGGPDLPTGYRSRLRRYRYGPAAYKVDWLLDGPVPWRNADCARAGTVHLGGTLEEIVAAESAVARGTMPDRPFVLLTQPSIVDPSRAPRGQHVVWAYAHVPHGFAGDATAAIEAQVERFAPGFGARVVARNVMTPVDLEAHNPNYVGGDINGGLQDWRQLFTRPVAAVVPYQTPLAGVYLCSSSTPPGGGVHGMCGVHAARNSLAFLARRRRT